MKAKVAITVLLATVFSLAAAAQQQPQTPEQREKLLYENIQKQVDDLATRLDLEDWQIFYADSILTRNYTDLSKEFEKQSANKVSDSSIYQLLQDECSEKNYLAFKAILSEEQWAKYLKQGAAKAKKDRDRRAAKRQQKS